MRIKSQTRFYSPFPVSVSENRMLQILRSQEAPAEKKSFLQHLFLENNFERCTDNACAVSEREKTLRVDSICRRGQAQDLLPHLSPLFLCWSEYFSSLFSQGSFKRLFVVGFSCQFAGHIITSRQRTLGPSNRTQTVENWEILTRSARN